jgi:hypothetical protein
MDSQAIKQEEQWAWRDEAAILIDDVSTIGAWLDSVAAVAGLEVQQVRDREPVGQFLWSVKGLQFPWRCEAVYERSHPGVVVVRLCADVSDPDAMPEMEDIGAACARCPAGRDERRRNVVGCQPGPLDVLAASVSLQPRRGPAR